MNFPQAVVVCAFVFSLMVSCSGPKEKAVGDSLPSADSFTGQTEMPALPVSQNIEPKTFVVTDESGKQNGWGYDLFIDGKRTIHQPIIPSLPGNNSFQSEADAMKMGQLAANRMKNTGTFPTIYPHDVDSLGIAVSKDIRHFLDSLNTVQSKKTNGK